MALRRALSKSLFPFSSSTASPSSSLRRTTTFLRHATNSRSSLLTIPVGELLREKLNLGGNRLRLDGLGPPPSISLEEEKGFGVTAEDVKRVVRVLQVEKVKEELLRCGGKSAVTYSEYLKACCDVFAGDREKGSELAKNLDESGNVVVLGSVVFLWPDQVAKSMEKLIFQSMALPNDPRRKELQDLEAQKALIDQKAQSLVRAELYCGLGFLVLQTLGFMRLTFWELSWDVMEPICFFVTSLHFALAYAFFLRTSKEPSFEGYFQRRFKVKQRKLMKIHDFDLERYNKLCEVFYPYYRLQKNEKDVVEPISELLHR